MCVVDATWCVCFLLHLFFMLWIIDTTCFLLRLVYLCEMWLICGQCIRSFCIPRTLVTLLQKCNIVMKQYSHFPLLSEVWSHFWHYKGMLKIYYAIRYYFSETARLLHRGTTKSIAPRNWDFFTNQCFLVDTFRVMSKHYNYGR